MMPDAAESPKTPKQQDRSKDSATPEDKELDRIADEAAKRAGETERRYDRSHDIFTK
jgi:hypothetical protein